MLQNNVPSLRRGVFLFAPREDAENGPSASLLLRVFALRTSTVRGRSNARCA
jgi:hypothetical protein